MSLVSDYSDGVPTIAFCLSDMEGTVLAAHHADLTFYSASTIKLGVLVAAIQAVERGSLSLDQPVVSSHTFTSGAAGHPQFSMDPEEYDAGMPADGVATTLAVVLGRMITVSSNEATNLAVELLGFPAVNAALAFCGASSSHMERLIGDVPALREGLSHQVTARDLTRIMTAIVTGKVAGPELTETMLGWLKDQQYPVIGLEIGQLAPGTMWGSKSGWVSGIKHDVAFAVPPGMDLSAGSILAVCTSGYEDDDAGAAIRALTAALLPG